MITGYMDENENVFCAECWKNARAVVDPVSILDTRDAENPDDETPFWVDAKSDRWGGEVKHSDANLLV